MTSDSDLPQQVDTLQQKSLTKKKSNLSWTGFFIDLVIIHATLFWVISTQWQITSDTILIILPFLCGFAIVDYISSMSFINKQTPPWRSLFNFILIVNAIYFGIAIFGPAFATQYYGSEITLGYIAIFGILFFMLIIDLIMIMIYRFTRHS